MANTKIRWYSTMPTDGPTGPWGPTGPQGPTGQKGEKGVTGPTGERGSSGPAGEQGVGGQQGEQGLTGRRGTPGRHGLKGAHGKQGDKLHLAWSCSATGACGFNQEGASFSDGGDFGYPGGCLPGQYDLSECSPAPATAYIGVLSTVNQLLPTQFLINPSSYTWFPFIGEDGSKGAIGSKGMEGPVGSAQYLHLAWNTEGGCTGTDFSTNSFANATWMGTYIDSNETDSSSCIDYDWNPIQGPPGQKGQKGDGDKGDKGEGDKGDKGEGDKGTKGDAGAGMYLHLAWAYDDAGTGFSVIGFTGATWIGTLVDFIPTDSGDWQDYDWNPIQGDKGDDGDSTYLHLAWNTEGGCTGTDFSTNSFANATWIGTLVDFIVSDSSSCTDYDWNPIQGPPGQQGQQGATQYGGPTGADGSKGDAGEKGTAGDKGDGGSKGSEGYGEYISFKYSLFASPYGDIGSTGVQCDSDPYYGGASGLFKPYIGVYAGPTMEQFLSCQEHTWSKYQGGAGDQGDDGDKGVKGNAGYKGSEGSKGTKGDGEKGVQGVDGVKGVQGNPGYKGQQGSQGNKGEYGAKGQQGVQGDKGDKGDKGSGGSKGDQGTDGSKGVIGSQGIEGDATYIHLNYSNNASGSSCNQAAGDFIGILVDQIESASSDCTDYDWYQLTGDGGPTGDIGTKGPMGQKGLKGLKGNTASKGEVGSKGNPGATQYGGPTGDKGVPGPSGPADINIINLYCPPGDPNCEYTIVADIGYTNVKEEPMWCGGVTGGDGRSVIAAYLSTVETSGSHSYSGEQGCTAKILGDGSTGAAQCIVESGSSQRFKCGCGVICQ